MIPAAEPPEIRVAQPSDAAALLAIYAPYIEQTAISFETVVPEVSAYAERMAGILPALPWLVAVSQGQPVGFAYAAPHHARAAYQWSVDVSVYLAPQAQGQGLGKRLYQRLFQILRALGYYNVYAGIALPNPGSVGLHQALGFEPVGIYRQVGYKFGAWHDVGWWQLSLQPHKTKPAPPLRFSDWTPD